MSTFVGHSTSRVAYCVFYCTIFYAIQRESANLMYEGVQVQCCLRSPRISIPTNEHAFRISMYTEIRVKHSYKLVAEISCTYLGCETRQHQVVYIHSDTPLAKVQNIFVFV
jgi:hypothetical protein